MCGIGGVLLFDGRPVDHAALARLAEAMTERGPDDEGVFTASGIGLVHRRLSIIDLSTAGRCPLPNEDGTYQLVFNGEIYNFRALRRELEDRGHHFRSNGDAEVVVHGYEEWGREVTRRLDGMFALAIWETKRRRLFLARDRLGQKPLYFARVNGAFVFASTLTALQFFLGSELTIDPLAVREFLLHGYVPGPRTIYSEARQLEPASHLTVDHEGVERQEHYWQLPEAGTRTLPTCEAEELVEETLNRSVLRRMVADVPVGGFLSGGVDSSLVMALAAPHANQLSTFSIGFEEDAYSELPYARQVAEAIGSNHHELMVSSKDLLDALPDLVWHYGQPYGDSSCIPTYYLSRFAREKVKVCLSGDGGDESFAGYRRALVAWQASLWARTLPERLRRTVVQHLCSGFGGPGADQSSLRARLGRLNEVSLSRETLVHHNTLSWRDRITEIAGEAIVEAVSAEETDARARPTPAESLLQRTLFDDLTHQLPNDFLVKVDVASMAASLEVRSPLLDHHLVETAWSLPDGLKIHMGRRKWLLKRLAARHVPSSVVYRKKMGFALPLSDWWSGPLRPALETLLRDSEAVNLGLIRREPVSMALTEQVGGLKLHATRLWQILCLELWLRVVRSQSLARTSSLLHLA